MRRIGAEAAHFLRQSGTAAPECGVGVREAVHPTMQYNCFAKRFGKATTHIEERLGATVTDIDGNLAYVACNTNGIQVVDVTNPAAPSPCTELVASSYAVLIESQKMATPVVSLMP